MPIAAPIDEALRDRPLDVVVQAVATIADTLRRCFTTWTSRTEMSSPQCDFCLYLAAARLSI